MITAFDPEALEEYHEAAQYSEDRFGLGRQFVGAVQAAIAAIESSPERFQSVGRGIRIFRMKRFPTTSFIFMRLRLGPSPFTPCLITRGTKTIGETACRLWSEPCGRIRSGEVC